ncbi:hypothetical protein MHU86_14157 [Fragilaria crotonensis]|nr:hypothetical protein MHU86_14157 [Fragilaria crotonensis]
MLLQIVLFLRHNQKSSEKSTTRSPPISPNNLQPLSSNSNVMLTLTSNKGNPAQYSQTQATTHTSQLPLWIRNYIAWHKEMIHKYPGPDLLTNPNAPKLLVRTCLGLCGGLHDRLGQLPWDLYLANQTGRLLFLQWERPGALENFLVPNEFNWTLPLNRPPPPTTASGRGRGGNKFKPFHKDMKIIRNFQEMFLGFQDDRPEAEFWATSLDFAIRRATVGEFKDVRVLRHRLLGHLDEAVLEQRLVDLGETDMLHWTPSSGHLFWAFFKPSPGVLAQLNLVYEEFGLQAGKYSAIHCRVRHPKATPKNVRVVGKSKSHPADKSGLPWYGSNRDFAIGVATKAVYCARALEQKQPPEQPHEPIYFFSDSNDLVRYMAHQLTDPEFRKQNATLFQNATDAAALKSLDGVRLIARDASQENAHIDRQKGREPPAYYGTFVDFLLAVNARCVTYGIGYYASFAVKLSGISCKQVYQEEEWGGREGTKAAAKCTLETYQHLL